MYERKLVTGSMAVLAAVAAVATVAAAPDAKAPRIVSAAMQDADGDSRADGVRLTYSERVRHALDSDGKYPFRVSGYRIRSVGRASGKTILLILEEQALADDEVRPAIAYRKTRTGSVVDRARNHAQAQVFRATKAHGKRPTEPPAPPPPTPAPASDADEDGTPDAQDCAPDDPKINPNAADLPDLAFVDSNCDGIDGTEQNAIYVSPDGKDGNPGTRAQPKREIQAAVVAAAGKGKYVLAAAGDYLKVNAATGVGIYGGYDPKSWKRALTLVTQIGGASEAILAIQDKNIVLQLLTVVGQGLDRPGESAYGIRAVSSELTLQRVTVRAGNGSRGAVGTDGTKGERGEPGGGGQPGQCDGGVRGAGGAGGTSPVGRPGGRGGQGGRDKIGPGENGKQGEVGTRGGPAGPSGNPGGDGADGSPGAGGAHGANGAGGGSSLLLDATWHGHDGGDGRDGTPGHGGGGGGGGGGQVCLLCNDGAGNGGGGGGAGGVGGVGGAGGRYGGGSFGLYLYESTATITDKSSIIPGAGGTGGAGGVGEMGSEGGDGGFGATYCKDQIGEGGDGGKGGSGGRGGGGGGGAGGPSIGIYAADGSKATVSADSTVRSGAPGLGGGGGAGGTGPASPGATGNAAPIVRA